MWDDGTRVERGLMVGMVTRFSRNLRFWWQWEWATKNRDSPENHKNERIGSRAFQKTKIFWNRSRNKKVTASQSWWFFGKSGKYGDFRTANPKLWSRNCLNRDFARIWDLDSFFPHLNGCQEDCYHRSNMCFSESKHILKELWKMILEFGSQLFRKQLQSRPAGRKIQMRRILRSSCNCQYWGLYWLQYFQNHLRPSDFERL